MKDRTEKELMSKKDKYRRKRNICKNIETTTSKKKSVLLRLVVYWLFIQKKERRKYTTYVLMCICAFYIDIDIDIHMCMCTLHAISMRLYEKTVCLNLEVWINLCTLTMLYKICM